MEVMLVWLVIYAGVGLTKYLIDINISPPFQPETVRCRKRESMEWILLMLLWPWTLEDTYNCLFKTKAGIKKNKKHIFDTIIQTNLLDINVKLNKLLTPPINKKSFPDAILQIAKSGHYYLSADQLKTEDPPEVLLAGMLINKIRYEVPSYVLTKEDVSYVAESVFDYMGYTLNTCKEQFENVSD